MRRYFYDKLFVSTFEPRYFDPQDPRSLRAAVDHLRTLEQLEFTQLTVEAPVRAGSYKLRAPAALKLGEIEGKTPAEVWEMFDAKIDEQIAYFTNRTRDSCLSCTRR